MSDQVTTELLDEVVRRIVESVHPRRIILFGSAARGQMGPNSDLDILGVMPDGIHRRQTARQVYRALHRLGVPNTLRGVPKRDGHARVSPVGEDVVVVTEGDVERFRDEPSLVIYPALLEGKEIYRAARQ
ncbi:MAG: nucleotidyltransferase domain-containing protein [Ardenticatenaceae bacterium]|nr:nucleotidyltransferase domain-containing protein [Ardenticatenaceae bacterium]